jgi:hypothetical protein
VSEHLDDRHVFRIKEHVYNTLSGVFHEELYDPEMTVVMGRPTPKSFVFAVYVTEPEPKEEPK